MDWRWMWAPDYRRGGLKVIRVILLFHRIVSTIPLTGKNEEERSVQMSVKKDSEAIVREENYQAKHDENAKSF
ncbi:MAG: hypothetical protein HOC20_05070 [Chloroflexi bacterium]|jgi:hypothetical protein|nr:hypothetical protein [Chloroflexota bacterium]